MAELFASQEVPTPQPARGPIVGVAVATALWEAYDYAWPEGLGEPAVGLRVQVPFGRGDRRVLGFVVRVGDRQTDRPLKGVAERLDETPQLDSHLLALAEWISHYYLTPLGLVLPAMVPAAVGRASPRRQSLARLAVEPAEWPSRLGFKQRRVLDELLEARKQGLEPVPIERLLRHGQASRDTLHRLQQRGLLTCETRDVTLGDLAGEPTPDPFDINARQREVADAVIGRLGKGFHAMLLHGVTGSGKTEVYIRAIRAVVARGEQAILLAPEIALTTQTLDRLAHRLPRVAVLHSGLTDAERAFHYLQIRDGHAAVVIGPRSAIFAPARNLGLIIVDEEHENSYKQDNAPRYHARDVAVKRASMAGVPVLLGSATPSLESFHNVQRGRYELLRLPERVRGLPLPKVQVVELRHELQRGRVELLGRTLTSRIAAALDAEEQVILLMNRRGYASFVFCPSCQWEMQCDNCSRAMVFHQATQLAQCHYCQDTRTLPEHCPACGKKLLLFGMGIQRIEDEIARKFPMARLARMDSDTMTTAGQFQRVLEGFRNGEYDILLGTQMVAKGLDFPRVSLVGVASADTSLAIPDFRSAERTFQLIVQVAGRAGRAETSGSVLVQTLHPGEPAIECALRHDVEAFLTHEMPQREEMNLPPFTRMVRLVVRHMSPHTCAEAAEKLADLLNSRLRGDPSITLTGPMMAPIARIRKKFRWHLFLTCPQAGRIQSHLKPLLTGPAREIGAEIVTDVDPTTLA